MTIATCPHCLNTGAIGAGYCDCPAATALRARVERNLAAGDHWRALGCPPGEILPHETTPVIGVDLGFEPAVAVVGHSCARCKTLISTSDDWATVRAAVHAHRIICPAPGPDNLGVN